MMSAFGVVDPFMPAPTNATLMEDDDNRRYTIPRVLSVDPKPVNIPKSW